MVLVTFLLIQEGSAFAKSPTYTSYDDTNLIVHVTTEGHEVSLQIPLAKSIFAVTPHFEDDKFVGILVNKKPGFEDFYKSVGFSTRSHSTVIIYPVFTQAAYSPNGFYDYYKKKCDEKCLTVSIPHKINGDYSASAMSELVFPLLNYSYITDVDIDKNPDILKQYEKVIVLHNEYVTKREFDAITHHPDVVFLYPNALYAEVHADYSNNVVTLVRGHGYPDPHIENGFDWKYDNSKHEFNVMCDNWNFYKRGNYSMLNCYPEYRILYDRELLRSLQMSDPTDLTSDISNWFRYPQQKEMIQQLLSDYDAHGSHIPDWVQNPAIMLLNGEITKEEFSNLVIYLYDNKIIT